MGVWGRVSPWVSGKGLWCVRAGRGSVGGCQGVGVCVSKDVGCVACERGVCGCVCVCLCCLCACRCPFWCLWQCRTCACVGECVRPCVSVRAWVVVVLWGCRQMCVEPCVLRLGGNVGVWEGGCGVGVGFFVGHVSASAACGVRTRGVVVL